MVNFTSMEPLFDKKVLRSSPLECVLYTGFAKGGFSALSLGASYTLMRLIPEYIRYVFMYLKKAPNTNTIL